MKSLLAFDFANADIDAIHKALMSGMIGLATDSLQNGMSTVWLFLQQGTAMQVQTKMTEISEWREIGTLVIKQIPKNLSLQKMRLIPTSWLEIESIKRLTAEDGEFSSESGLEFTNKLGEVLIIVCSANPCLIEVSAPFFNGDFLPEYELSHYKRSDFLAPRQRN